MTGKDAKSETASGTALPDVLTTVGHELRLLSDATAELQDLVGNLMTAGAFAGSQSVYGLQCLDRICQNVEAIADFLAGVAKQSSPDWTIDVAEASRTVKLAEVSERLAGRADGGEKSAGDFDDFTNFSLAG